MTIITELLANPRFDSHGIDRVREEIELMRKETQPEEEILDAVYAAAFYNNTLGNPLYPSLADLTRLTPETLHKYHKTVFTPSRVVFGASGVDHDLFVKKIENSFARLLPTEDTPQKPEYTGGELRIHRTPATPEAATHFAVGFEAFNWRHPDVFVAQVLGRMMGTSKSFSTGGPGKGMHARSSLLLNKNQFIHSASCIPDPGKDAGLFIYHSSCATQDVPEMLDAVTRSLRDMPANISKDEVQRAKNSLKCEMLQAAENRASRTADFAAQVLTYDNKTLSPADLIRIVDNITRDDFVRVAKSILKSKPSIVGIGDLSTMPRYEEIVSMLSQ